MGRTGTYGVDLAAQPKNTAVCMIEWLEDGRGRVDCPGLGGASDDEILSQMARDDVAVAAIDAPFGWPIQFAETLLDYAAHGSWPDPPGVQAKQETMRLRVTDRVVWEETKLTPLSVSTDRIGVVAMRCARLLAAHWRTTGLAPDRSGKAGIVEVYPAAALVQWGISQRSGVSDPGTYKGNSAPAAARRVRIIEAIASAAPWLEINGKVRVVCANSDDCLDALICALVARAYELARTLPIADAVAADAEGWIHLPTRQPLGVLGPI
jgi:predicted nuclease with RNAse H fold